MRARLIGYVEQATIEPIDRANTYVDSEAGEPYAQLARSSQITILAQVEEVTENRRQVEIGGAVLPVRFELTFLTRDCSARGWTPADGDRLVALANRKGGNSRTVNLYLQLSRYSGKTSCGRELIVVDAVDRSPYRTHTEGL